MKLIRTIATIFVAISAILVLASCTTATKSYSYVGEKLTYPAVYKAVLATIKNAKFDSIDFYGNKYVLKGLGFLDGINRRTADLVITVANGEFKYDFINGQMFFTSTGTWITDDSYLFATPLIVGNQMNKIIEKTMQDDATYDEARKTALQDIGFVYLCMENMNEISIADFVKNVLGSQAIQITATVFDVKVANETVNNVVYKYRVQSYVKAAENDALGFTKDINFFFYTNDDTVARYNRGSTISALGRIVSGGRNDNQLDGFSLNVIQVPN